MCGKSRYFEVDLSINNLSLFVEDIDTIELFYYNNGMVKDTYTNYYSEKGKPFES